MDILRLVGFGLAVVFLIILVGEQNKTYAGLIRLLASAIFLLCIIPEFEKVMDMIKLLSDHIQINDTYMMIVLKVIGIAYIAEFGYQLCKDAGEEAVANKIQLAGKVMILVLASPIAVVLIEMIVALV